MVHVVYELVNPFQLCLAVACRAKLHKVWTGGGSVGLAACPELRNQYRPARFYRALQFEIIESQSLAVRCCVGPCLPVVSITEWSVEADVDFVLSIGNIRKC